MDTETKLMSKALDAVYGSLEKPANDGGAAAAVYSAECRKLREQLDKAQGELDEIRDLLPDESPCKHEQTGCSLYDDIQELVLRSEGNTKVYNEVFGIFHKAGFHSGTVQDKAREAVAKALRLEMALRRILTIHWGYDGDCGAVRIAEDALAEQPVAKATGGAVS